MKRMRPPWIAGLLTMFAVAGLPETVGADEPSSPLAEALGREIIGPKLTMAETADYCEERVPRMPPISSAEEWREYADALRAAVLDEVVFRGEARAWRDAPARVEWLGTIETGPGYRLKKLRYEAIPGLWVPALLYEPDDLADRPAGSVPAVLNVNGHDGAGKAADYKQIRCVNQARRGMLALNVEWLGMGQLQKPEYHHELINAIDLCGTSGIATHYLMMSKALDLLLGLEPTDPQRVAVTGLSGGGWQTIFISALDTRVGLSVPVAGYSSFLTRARYHSDLGDSEQTPTDLATIADYTHLTAMLAPRPSLLIYNANDQCCFRADHALPPLLRAAEPIFDLFGQANHLRSHVNHDPGTHNYEIDNRQALYRMLGDHFFTNDPEYDPIEIPGTADEVKTAEDLHVELPEENASLHSLARDLIGALPREPDLPDDADEARAWQTARRAALGAIVRAKRYDDFQVLQTAETMIDDVRATSWRIRLNQTWSVPVVELVRGEPTRTTIVVADEGRAHAADLVETLLDDDHRLLAVDPFYLGEAHPESRAYLWALLVATVGDRPLGLQASQLGALARWTRQEYRSAPVTLVARGQRAGIAALVAAALEEDAIGRVEVYETLGSLKELIEQPTRYSQAPELFCFGLLEAFDVKQLAALVAPRPVVVHAPSDRVRTELHGLADWYATLGTAFDPLQP